MIDNFRGDNFFLSNFYPTRINFLGHVFPTLEHAYQAAKANTQEELIMIRDAKTPGEAKKLSYRVRLRSDWNEVRERIMELLLLQKFLPETECARLLVKTGDEPLLEGNTWHDNFWGSCSCPRCVNIKGENVLGKTLMKIREDLRSIFDVTE